MDALTREEVWRLASGRGWRLDHHRTRTQARVGFGVQGSLEFTRRRGSAERWGGWHSWDGSLHRIHVIVYPGMRFKDYLDTLAHELRHAWQAEQFDGPVGWNAAIRTYWPDVGLSDGIKGMAERANPDGPRQDDPFEIDANEAAERLWPLLLPCVRLTKGAR